MSPDGDDWLREAVARVERQELLAYPTETSWGLGANAAQPDALERLRGVKGERGQKPFSVLVSGVEVLEELGFEAGPAGAELAKRFWPGPLTLVLRCRAPWARGVGRRDGAVAVRCSSHPVASRLAAALAAHSLGPLTSTSLNRSGEEPAQRYGQARRFCDDAGCFLAAPKDAEAGGVAASTIVDLSGPSALLLRCGAVTRESLSRWISIQ